jgi:malate dehydrogenase (oxaloacetate-decarboxylating)(NADP+)
VLGPMIVGLKQSVQICSLSAPVSEIVTLATLAAYDVNPAK